MADITDPEVIRFTNEQIRPLCEAARALKARIESMDAAWDGGIGAKCPGDTSPLDDGREAEGVSRLTGYDVGIAHDSLVNAAGQLTDAIIEKPCVRPLFVQ